MAQEVARETVKEAKEIVKDVILQLAQGFKARDLADKYNVHKSTIFNIKNKKTWRHVTGE